MLILKEGLREFEKIKIFRNHPRNQKFQNREYLCILNASERSLQSQYTVISIIMSCLITHCIRHHHRRRGHMICPKPVDTRHGTLTRSDGDTHLLSFVFDVINSFVTEYVDQLTCNSKSLIHQTMSPIAHPHQQ